MGKLRGSFVKQMQQLYSNIEILEIQRQEGLTNDNQCKIFKINFILLKKQ